MSEPFIQRQPNALCVGFSQHDRETDVYPMQVRSVRHCALPIRKSVVSIKFPPAILGPARAAPILWAPGIFWFFLLENPHAHKIPPFRGGVVVFLEGGGGSANFIFMGVGIFPILGGCKTTTHHQIRLMHP